MIALTPSEALTLTYKLAGDLSMAIIQINMHLARFMVDSRETPITWRIPPEWQVLPFVKILERHYRDNWVVWNEGETHGGNYRPLVIKFQF